ncbi:OsmC family protein [Thermodesulfobacteriota bacterium]
MDLISVDRDEGEGFSIRVRGHAVKSDMSEEEGGLDRGPSPVELMAGSLGACIAIMVQSYCDRNGYDGEVGVSMTLELADKPKRIKTIVMDLDLPESVPEKKKEAIKRVARHCPIHETLKNPPVLDIEIV